MRISIATVALIALLAAPVMADTILLTGTIRDFHASHPDMEDGIAVDPGIVLPDLGGDGLPVYAGLAGNPTTHGMTAFDQWYNDTVGVNLSTSHSITLDNTITGDPAVFTFVDTTFFPIDGALFGNEGNIHNYHFTYEIHTTFNYAGGESFSFTGDDDLWVFINGKLAIDLGGVHGALSATVSLDAAAAALGITTGMNYTLDIFFAERHTSASSFRIDTSIALVSVPPGPTPIPEPGTIVLFGLAAAGAARARRRRARNS